jgi:hypothetical protein
MAEFNLSSLMLLATNSWMGQSCWSPQLVMRCWNMRCWWTTPNLFLLNRQPLSHRCQKCESAPFSGHRMEVPNFAVHAHDAWVSAFIQNGGSADVMGPYPIYTLFHAGSIEFVLFAQSIRERFWHSQSSIPAFAPLRPRHAYWASSGCRDTLWPDLFLVTKGGYIQLW